MMTQTISAYWGCSYDMEQLLLLELIAPSRTAHARTSREELCGCSAREMAWEIPEIFLLLAHNSMRLCLLEFCLNIFVVSCFSLSEVR